LRINNIILEIKIGDITDEHVDTIVNAANNTLLGGGGVDGAIHEKGGPSILKQCIVHSGCPTGEARITTAGDLPSRYIIHTVGPIYGENSGLEDKLLYNAYYNSLLLAADYKLTSISFPSISTGAYSFPIEEAIKIVLDVVIDFSKVKTSIQRINLVLFNEEDYDIYNEYLKNIMSSF